MGALHANPQGPSEYLKTKYAGETLAMEADHLDTTSFRPSVIFGAKGQLSKSLCTTSKITSRSYIPARLRKHSLHTCLCQRTRNAHCQQHRR